MGVLRRLDRLLRGREPAEPIYECRSCGAAYEVRYFVCPECRGFSVDRREWRIE
jgi:lipopolysaccharide biosynthesis regulator YciM